MVVLKRISVNVISHCRIKGVVCFERVGRIIGCGRYVGVVDSLREIKEYSKSCEDVDPERLEWKLWSYYGGVWSYWSG